MPARREHGSVHRSQTRLAFLGHLRHRVSGSEVRFLAEVQPARGKQVRTGWTLCEGVWAGRRHQGTEGVSPCHGGEAACAGHRSGPDAACSCQGASMASPITLCPSTLCLRGRPWGWRHQPLPPCAFWLSPPGLPVEVRGREEGEVRVPITRVPPLQVTRAL